MHLEMEWKRQEQLQEKTNTLEARLIEENKKPLDRVANLESSTQPIEVSSFTPGRSFPTLCLSQQPVWALRGSG
jgi:hypothetical protein